MSSSPPQNASGSPPTSPRRTGHHRGSSHHLPITPSRLRKSIAAASGPPLSDEQDDDKLISPSPSLLEGLNISAELEPSVNQSDLGTKGGLVEPSQREADARTRLLEDYNKSAICGVKDCNHGTFSPHIGAHGSNSSNVSTIDGFGGRCGNEINAENGEPRDRTRGLIGDTFADELFGGSRRGTSMSTTKWLATKHGVKNQRTM
jgi:hypothetical protein